MLSGDNLAKTVPSGRVESRSANSSRDEVEANSLGGTRIRVPSQILLICDEDGTAHPVPSARFELPTCGLGRRDRLKNALNRYRFEGFLCHL